MNNPLEALGISAKSPIGSIFVAFGFASREQVDGLLLARESDKRPGAMFADAMVAEKIVSKRQRAFVLQVQNLLKATSKKSGNTIVLDKNTFIGQILCALGYITDEQLRDTLAFQESERKAGRDPGRIGELLVSRNICTIDQRDLGMKVQDLLRGAA